MINYEDLRAFWRLLFDVINVEKSDGTMVAEPRLCVEMVLWDIVEKKRLGRRMKRLLVMQDPPDSVKFADSTASFTDGYLWAEFDRTDMENELISDLHESLEGLEFGELSSPVGEYNVAITAHVRLLDDGSTIKRPLFYMRQPSIDGNLAEKGEIPTDAVCLAETVHSGGDRTIEWSISGDYDETGKLSWIDDQPDLDPPRGWHRIRVQQDADNGIYEFIVDSITLDKLPAVPSAHYFFGEPVVIYIGGMPNRLGGIIGLTGEISYLEFDPNAPCGNCAG